MTRADGRAARPSAVVLLSGGLDSTTCLAIARADGFDPVALSFDYGQRHRIELERAAAIAAADGCEHIVVRIDLGSFGGSALTDPSIAVPRHVDPVDDTRADGDVIPVTYVPARNTVFLSYALALAEVRGAADVYIGVNAIDYSGYPDCRPEFIAAFETVANLATRAAVEGRRFTVHAPLQHLGKADIVRRAVELGVDLSRTVSCYDLSPAGVPCGACDACVLRSRGFAAAGIDDPALPRA